MIEYLRAAELMKDVGVDNTEFLKRAKFVEGVRIAIARGDVGFRGGWVSSTHIASDLHPKQWAGLLESLGFVLHPSMAAKGRSDTPVTLVVDSRPGELREAPGKSWLRLFVLKGSPGESVEDQVEAIRAFKRAQMTS